MDVVVAPESFKSSLTSVEASEIMRKAVMDLRQNIQ